MDMVTEVEAAMHAARIKELITTLRSGRFRDLARGAPRRKTGVSYTYCLGGACLRVAMEQGMPGSWAPYREGTDGEGFVGCQDSHPRLAPSEYLDDWFGTPFRFALDELPARLRAAVDALGGRSLRVERLNDRWRLTAEELADMLEVRTTRLLEIN